MGCTFNSVVFAVIIGTLFYPSNASHFRGAIITWKPGSNKGDIIVEYRISWRMSYAYYFDCNDDKILRGQTIGGRGDIKCFSNCYGSFGNLYYQCTDYSSVEDWSTGKGTITQTLVPFDANSSIYYFGFEGAAWITLNVGGGAWKLKVKADLSIRPDTDTINRSPTAETPPVVRLQTGCNNTIKVPVQDADDDLVRCRWATGDNDECGGVCEGLPGSYLNADCTITYETVNSLGWYAVALQVEDFVNATSTTPLSSIPVQFLVFVYASNESCAKSTEFVGPTPPDDACIGVPEGELLELGVVARVANPDRSISEIKTLSPLGMFKSKVYKISATDWRVNVTWNSSHTSDISNIFCFTAKESSGLESEKRCITLLKDVSPPTFMNGTQSPVGRIFPSQRQWKINTDKDIKQTSRSAFIRIYDSKDSLVESVDASLSHYISVNSTGKSLQFITTSNLKEKETYYFLFDLGVVKGTQYCGADSTAINEQHFWRITIVDVTPPLITMITNPEKTNSTTRLQWKVNELVTTECKLTTPIGTTENISVCNDSWVGTDLTEGRYAFIIKVTDFEGNVAYKTVIWDVDTTQPVVSFAATPSLKSNEKNLYFFWSCDEPCTSICSILEHGQKSADVASYGRTHKYFAVWTVPEDVAEATYTFEALVADEVGNIAKVNFTWTTDFLPPDIHLCDEGESFTVDCTNDLKPASICNVTVNDNVDSLPKLTYVDTGSQTCGIVRKWMATDKAGNIAEKTQTINVVTQQQIAVVRYPGSLSVACGALESMTDILISLFEIKHPCDLDVKYTYEDNPKEKCGVLINRTWTIFDDCGKSVKVFQFLKVLEAKKPLFPEDGQTGVDLNMYLRWQGASTSTQFKVYLWERGLQTPKLPSYVTYNNYHKVTILKPETKYQWQVMFLFDNNETYLSPDWVFETRKFADLTVVTIETPPSGFTDHDCNVKWTVMNTGSIATQSRYWYDAVYLSWETTFENAKRVKTVYQRNIIYPNDGYSSAATFKLSEEEYGNAYIFVRTDYYDNINEYNTTNNLMRSSATIDVKLTPPPDLQVISIILPGTRVFSGTEASVTWTIANKGQGPTRNSRWLDRVWWSKSQTLNRESRLLYSGTHYGNLETNANYTLTAMIRIPGFITGDYFILIETDAYDHVFEHLNENNNILAAQTPIYVALTPPPDLVVRSIESPREWKTGETVNVTWIVDNIGHDSPKTQIYWQDEAVLTSLTTTWQRRIGIRPHYNVIKSGDFYTSSITVYVTPDIASGEYNVTITADYRNNLFEFTYESNNRLTNFVTVKQEFPDLTIVNFTISLDYFANATRLNAFWKAKNIGEQKTFSGNWVDSIMAKPSNDGYTALSQIEIYEQNGLPNGQSYAREVSFDLPFTMYGKVKFRLAVDELYRATGDKNMSNNALVTEEISVDFRAADLIVLENITTSKKIQAGKEFSLTYTILNAGNMDVVNTIWEDRIFIVENIDDPSTLHSLDKSLEVDLNIKVNETYFRTVFFFLPEVMSGDYVAVVVTDIENVVFEGPKTHNNKVARSISIEPASAPDLAVLSIEANLLDSQGDGNIVSVVWQVNNIGNSMSKFQSWFDKITYKTEVDSDTLISLMSYPLNTKLESEAQYEEKRNMILPSNVSGIIFVCVTVDSLGNIYEANSKLNNFICQDSPIEIETYTAAFVTVNVDKILALEDDQLIVPGSKVSVEFTVKNTGDLATVMSSWIDSVYLISREPSSTVDLKKNGVRVQDIVHIGILKPSHSYTVTSSFSVPKGYSENPFIYIVAVNTETSEDENDTTSVGQNTTNPDSTLSPSIGSYKQPILVSLNMPNLHIKSNQTLGVLQGGQPVTVDYIVQNIGNYSTQSVWFDSAYLSDDFVIDAFDVRLKTVLRSFKANVGQDVALNISFILPLDMATKSYYLVIVCDSRNDIFEENENDNEIRLVLDMETRSSTDIVITDIVAPEVTVYGSVMDVLWNVINNGSQSASGYKCDSVYLSEDHEWDISDQQVGQPICSVFSLAANRSSQISNEISSSTPPVSAKSYNTLVKSRSNVIDLNLANNVAIANHKTKVTYNSLSVGSSTKETLRSDAFIAMQIVNVSEDRTLVVNVSSNSSGSLNYVYIKTGSPATFYDFDALSADPNVANQIVTIPATIRGDYYILIENKHSSSSAGMQTITIIAKYAQFEILNVYPRSLIFDAETTFRISGTLFPRDMEAYLINTFNSTTSFQAVQSYVLSSTEAYMTFHIPKETSLTSLSLLVTSSSQNISTVYKNNIQVIKGTKGYLSVTVESPGRLRNEEEGIFKVNFQNLGDSDILAPLLYIEAVGNGTIRLDDQMKTEFYQKWYLLFGLTDHGPAGIIPPKSYGVLKFKTRQDISLRRGQLSMTLSVSEIKCDSETTNPFLQIKNHLRPLHYSEEAWKPIWHNFLSVTGNSTLSLQKKMSTILNEMSIGGRRVLKVYDIVKFLIDFADAPFGDRTLVFESDINVQTDSHVRLAVDRFLSARIGTRKQAGYTGNGWILPLWDTKILKIGELVMTIEIEKENFDFIKANDAEYIHSDLGVVKLINSEFVLRRYKDSKEFHFDASSLKLIAVASSVDQSNLTLLYEKSLLTQVRHSDGSYISVKYNTDDRIQAMDLMNSPSSTGNEKVLYTYDYDSGMLREVTTIAGTTKYSYNYKDYSIQYVTYDDGTMFAFEYNDFRHIASRKFIVNSRVLSAQEYTYSNGGMLSVRSDQDKNGYSLIFSEKGDVILVNRIGFLPDKTVITKNTETTFQGESMVLRRTLDEEGKRLTIEDGNDDRIQTFFNDVGQLTLFVDGGGNKYTVFLNENGTLRNIFFPDGTNETYSYYDNGHVISTQNGRNKRYEYNERKQLVLKDIGENKITSYEYDDAGNVVKAVNDEGEISISYKSTRPSEIQYPDETVRYQYNENGQLTHITTDNGYYIKYNYNALGLVREVLDKNDNIIASVEYSPTGKVMKKTLGNGAFVQYEYANFTGLLKSLTNFYPNGSVASFFSYSYSTRNQRITVDTIDGKWKFKYDKAGQIIAMTDPRGNTTEYTYDNRKNRKIISRNGVDTQTTINEMNQYVKYDSISYRYDKNGNVMEKNSTDTEKFSFDEDNKMIKYESDKNRCEFYYDALGNLQSKLCSGKVTKYLIDPRGNYGMDILEQIQGEADNLSRIQFYHGGQQIGLIAARHDGDNMHYFLYDPIGSVVNILNSDGELLNSYERNPFGELIASSENVKSIFTFVGQWGVIDMEEMPGIFLMRSRWYDSYTGRFMSMDPLGLQAQSKNFYVYCSNNPVHFNDPRGTCPWCLLVLKGAVKGAGKGLLDYGLSTPIQDWSWGGATGAIVTGGLKGAINPVRKFLPKWAEIAYDSGAQVLGNWAKHAVDGEPYSFNQGLHDFIDSAVDGTEGALEDASDKFKDLNDAIKKVCSFFSAQKCTPSDKLKDIVKRVADDVVRWVMSLDPNDILGPTGYGAARFIPKDTILQYKIRFENDGNATAPAQRVYIEHEYNENINTRTFLLGEFGFGNFTKSVPTGSKYFQGALDLTDEMNIYVRVFAGLDLVKKLVVWEFQTVDPDTGEAPLDPGIGFLPPNNGTSGQGFVTFSVQLKTETSHLATVHANASIYFDQNEPIDAPNIFNTVDDSYPQMNGSVIPETVSADSVTLSLKAEDTGSGVKHVDLFHQSGSGFVLYEAGITATSYTVNLEPGDNFVLLPIAVDQVGNRPLIDDDGQNNVINVTSSKEIGDCECTGNGNCTSGTTTCDCFEGYYGPNCNSTVAPSEPPVLTIRGGTGYAHEQIRLTISARNMSGRLEDLYIIVSDYPPRTTFSKGETQNHSRLLLNHTEFGPINMSVDQSGEFTLRILALQTSPLKNLTRNGHILVKVYGQRQTVDITSGGCFFGDNDGNILAKINVSVKFDNDSMNVKLSVWLTLPSWIHVNDTNHTGGMVSVEDDLSDMILDLAGRFEPFSFAVNANILDGDYTSVNFSKTFEVTQLCDGDCDQNVYGVTCENQCLCDEVHTESCNTFNGTCSCTSGWEGPFCNITDTDCDQNMYGVNCEYQCVCDEAHTESCNKLNGTCSCKSGWEGPFCNITDTVVCDCIANHTANCDEENDTCLCKDGWNGDRCEIDVNECSNASICDGQINTACQNRDWGYDCLCLVGFKLENSSCVEVDTGEKVTVTPGINERATSVVVVIDYDVPVFHNLVIAAIYETYRQKAHTMLAAFYSESLGNRFVSVFIRSLSRGSLIIDHVVMTKDDIETSQALAIAIVDMSSKNTNLVYDEKAVLVGDIKIDDVKVEDVCKVYTSINPCNQSECMVEQNKPVCRASPDSKDDDTILYISLAVVASVLLLAIVITVYCLVRKGRRETKAERRRRSNNQSRSIRYAEGQRTDTRFGTGEPLQGYYDVDSMFGHRRTPYSSHMRSEEGRQEQYAGLGVFNNPVYSQR